MKDLQHHAAWRLQFITHATPQYDHLEGARLALEGGCRWIQLRMKGCSPLEIRQVGHALRQLTWDYHATMILDDHVELVAELEADGVHLGLQDMPIREARRELGEEKIIGGTANSMEDIQQHYLEGADYIGCGPYRFTRTKERLAPLLGLEGYQRLLQEMRARGIQMPLVAIGGITRADIPRLRSVGVEGIALSGALLGAEDPIEETRIIRTLIANE